MRIPAFGISSLVIVSLAEYESYETSGPIVGMETGIPVRFFCSTSSFTQDAVDNKGFAVEAQRVVMLCGKHASVMAHPSALVLFLVAARSYSASEPDLRLLSQRLFLRGTVCN